MLRGHRIADDDFDRLTGSSISPLVGETFEKIFADGPFYFYLAKLFSTICKPIIEPLADLLPTLKVDEISQLSKADRARKFDEHISRAFAGPEAKRQPVAVNFCRQVMMPSSPSSSTIQSASCTHHTALIVGRRKLGSTCQVLVRETLGPACDAEM